MASIELIEKLEQTIQNIPDFPLEGIQFKDITPIFLDPKLYTVVNFLSNLNSQNLKGHLSDGILAVYVLNPLE